LGVNYSHYKLLVRSLAKTKDYFFFMDEK